MMNIWIINHYAMPPQYETRIRNNIMAKYLKEKGYDVKIFAASTMHNTGINLIEDKRTLYIEKNYDELNFVHVRTSNYSDNGFARIKNMMEFPLRLIKTAKKMNEKPDIIICDLEAIFAWSPYWISKKFNCKFILEVRDLWPESIVDFKGVSKNNPIIIILYKIEKWIYKKSNAVVFSMEGGKDYIIDKGWQNEIDMSKIYHINNGVDLYQFNYNKSNCKTVDEDLDDVNSFKVIYAGSIRQANNVKRIIDVAENLKNKGYNKIKFLIYGDGTEKKELEQYCLRKKIDNVVFKGYIDKNKIAYILSKGDLNILNYMQVNILKYGGSQNKLFEYLASGKPTLSTVKMNYDILEKYECGLSVDSKNSNEIVEGILKFYNMSNIEYEYYCSNALKAANKYDYKLLTNELEKLIQNDYI